MDSPRLKTIDRLLIEASPQGELLATIEDELVIRTNILQAAEAELQAAAQTT